MLVIVERRPIIEAGKFEWLCRRIDRRLELDDRVALEPMNGDVKAPSILERLPEEERRPACRLGTRQRVADIVRIFAADKRIKFQAVDFTRYAEHFGAIGGMAQHLAGAGVAGDEAPMGLDAPRNVDRLTIAIVKSDRAHFSHHQLSA